MLTVEEMAAELFKHKVLTFFDSEGLFGTEPLELLDSRKSGHPGFLDAPSSDGFVGRLRRARTAHQTATRRGGNAAPQRRSHPATGSHFTPASAGGPAALGLRLRHLLELIEVQTAAAMAAAGSRVKAQCSAILLLLDCEGPLSLTKIASRLRTSHQLTSQRVSWLKSGGFVEVLADPEDRRRRQVVLAAAGKKEGRKLQSFLVFAEKAYGALFEELGLDLLAAVVETDENLRARPLEGRLREIQASGVEDGGES